MVAGGRWVGLTIVPGKRQVLHGLPYIYPRRMRVWALLISWVLLWLVGHGQDPVYRPLSNQSGLPSNTVYYVQQDDRGFVWLGHDRGLCRFDGSRFVSYQTSMLQGFSLTNLMTDQRGRVWAQDFSGNFYHTEADSLVREPAISQGTAYGIAGMVGGRWLVSVKYDSLRVLDINSGRRRSLPMPGRYTAAVCFDARYAYFICGATLYRFDGEQLSPHLQLPQPLTDVFFLQPTAEGFVAFTKQQSPQAWLLRPGRAEGRRLFDKAVFIQEVSKIGREIWLSTTAGAYCFSESLAPLYGGHCFFAGSSISRIMKDREGSYWFGTLDKGVLMVPNLHTRLYAADGEAITALASAGPTMLLAGTSMHRLLGFDTRTRQFSSLYKAPTNHEVLHIYHRPESEETLLCSDRILYLRRFALQRQYMLAGKNVAAVADGWYAHAYASGMGFLNPGAGRDTAVPWPWLKIAAAVQGRGRWVQYRPADSLLLVATSRGLYYYHPGGWGTLQLQGQPVYASGMQQAGPDVWLTTYSQGVLLMDSSRQLRRLAVPGLPSSIYKLHVQDSLVWMLTDEGVLRYHRHTGQLRRYSVASGLPLAEYKDMRWQDGHLYLATTQGLVVFAAADMGSNQTPPLLALNQVQVNGETISAPDALMALASDENNLRVSFSVLAYKHVPAQVVRYRMNGQAWQTLEPGVRVLYLQALAPGKYSLQLQAFNEDGVGSVQPIQLQFRIKAPLYRQPWFWLLLGLLAMGSIYTYFKLRLRRLQRANALRTQQMMLEQELQQSKLASIKSQMNPHFFFNALNTIQSYIYTNDKDQAAHYLNQFSELTRMVLDMSNKDLISLTEEIKALQLYLDLEALRFEGKLHYSLELSPDLQPDQFWLPPMLVQPYIENAIKHGLLHSKRPWQLRVQFSRGASGLLVVVDDNGIGRKKSEQLNAHRYRQHQSFAMSANARRLEILNKGLTNVISVHITDKTDEWGMPAGTTVALHVPLQSRISSH